MMSSETGGIESTGSANKHGEERGLPCLSQPAPDRDLSSDQEQIEFLKVEVEHFYKAETQGEQRASWLLTIAFGGLVLVLNFFLGSSQAENMRVSTHLLFTLCAAFLFIAIILALWAIWPLRGRGGVLQPPFGSGFGPRMTVPPGGSADLWVKQYAAHRTRAEKKAVRVVWTILLLGLAILTGAAAMLTNLKLT
jgi:hypothetical protein